MDAGDSGRLVETHASGGPRPCEAVSSGAPWLHETHHYAFLRMLRLQRACQLLGQCACRCASPREPRGSRGNANGLCHPSHPSPPRHREPPLLCRYAGTCRWVVVTVWRGGPAHTPPQRPAPAAPGVRPFTLGKAPGRVQCGTEVAPEAALAIGLVRCRRKAPERCTGRPSALQRHATGGNHGMADTTKVTRAIYQTS